MTRLCERVLRAAAIVIALLGLVDPALTLPWRDRPIVSVITVRPSPREDRPVAHSPLTGDAARVLHAQVVSTLAREFDVRSGAAAGTAAIVLLGDGRSPAAGSLPASLDTSLPRPVATSPPAPAAASTATSTSAPASTSSSASGSRAASSSPAASVSASSAAAPIVSAVVPAPMTTGVRIARIDAPRRAHVSARVPITVQVEARGLAGRTSTIVVRGDGLDLARHVHTWPQDDARRDGNDGADASRTAGAADTDADAAVATRGDPRRVDTRAVPAGAARAGSSAAPDTQRVEVTLSPRPLRVAPTRFTVDVLGAPDAPQADRPNARQADRQQTMTMASADVVVDIHDRPLRVLFMDARPSWTTRFIRRALEDDARFAVSAATRVSRGITASSGGAPPSLAGTDLEPFHAIVVGAPELLTRGDVDRLRTFARERGGVVVIAPDRQVEGPVLDLLPARGFTERLLPDPQTLVAAGSRETASSSSVSTASLSASELEVANELLPGADVLLRLAQASPSATPEPGATAPAPGSAAPVPAPAPAAQPAPSASASVVIGSALGEGAVIFSGALDAWRFRDRDEAAFDRFWRDTIATRAAAAPDPIEVTLDPAIAAPGEPIDVRVRVRPTATRGATGAVAVHGARAAPTTRAAAPSGSASTLSPASPASAVSTASTVSDARSGTVADIVRATLASAPSDASSSGASDDGGTPIRLWPGARPSAYDGALSAPSEDGVYAVTVRRDGEATAGMPRDAIAGRAMLRVARTARRARPAWPALQAFVEARGGLLVTADHLDMLAGHLRGSIRPAETRRARHPLRSAWWILPFAACLGGEWFLRRRRGER